MLAGHHHFTSAGSISAEKKSILRRSVIVSKARGFLSLGISNGIFSKEHDAREKNTIFFLRAGAGRPHQESRITKDPGPTPLMGREHVGGRSRGREKNVYCIECKGFG